MEVVRITINFNNPANLKYGWQNIKGTSSRTCACESWKQHWLKYSGESNWPKKCSIVGCNNPAVVGAHVFNIQSKDEYIIPLCGGCNHRKNTFEIEKGTKLASANVAKTCYIPYNHGVYRFLEFAFAEK